MNFKMTRIGMPGNFAGAVEEAKCIITAYCKARVELNGITQVNFVSMLYSVLPGIAVPVILFLWWQSEIEVKEPQRLSSLGIES